MTFDADFFDMSNLFGQPPKITGLKTGNRKLFDFARLWMGKNGIIEQFLSDEAFKHIACIEIDE
jgi:predicted nuclease of predicted toxin-antitoxin system